MKFPTMTVALLAGLSLAVSAHASLPQEVSREDLKIYIETQDALSDPRVQQMPEARRIPEIARRNFKLSGPALQTILDRVEGAGGKERIAERSEKAITAALNESPLKGRIQEVRVDTSSSHVVTYVKLVAEKGKVDEDVVLAAFKAGNAKPDITSTFYLWAVDEEGKDLFRGKIGAERTARIQERRIADWARSRYLRLFEIDQDRHTAAPAPLNTAQ